MFYTKWIHLVRMSDIYKKRNKEQQDIPLYIPQQNHLKEPSPARKWPIQQGEGSTSNSNLNESEYIFFYNSQSPSSNLE